MHSVVHMSNMVKTAHHEHSLHASLYTSIFFLAMNRWIKTKGDMPALINGINKSKFLHKHVVELSSTDLIFAQGSWFSSSVNITICNKECRDRSWTFIISVGLCGVIVHPYPLSKAVNWNWRDFNHKFENKRSFNLKMFSQKLHNTIWSPSNELKWKLYLPGDQF